MQECFNARGDLGWSTRMWRFKQTSATGLLKAMEPITYGIIALPRDLGNLFHGVAIMAKQNHLNSQSCARTTRFLVHRVEPGKLMPAYLDLNRWIHGQPLRSQTWAGVVSFYSASFNTAIISWFHLAKIFGLETVDEGYKSYELLTEVYLLIFQTPTKPPDL
jgi:hypothetical protein